MTDEPMKFICKALKEAVDTCGPMVADGIESFRSEAVAKLSAEGMVERGPLAGRRVRLTFEIVFDEPED